MSSLSSHAISVNSSHPTTYCPTCGQPLDTIVQVFPHRFEPLILMTCWNPACVVFGRTASASDVDDPMILAQWHATQQYDVVTGRAVETTPESEAHNG